MKGINDLRNLAYALRTRFFEQFFHQPTEVYGPSKRWAREIGLPIGQGLALGIEMRRDEVQKCIEDLPPPEPKSS